MTPTDPLALSALEQARRLRGGELSSESLTRAYLERIKALDEGVSAFVTVTAKRALRAARRADRELARRRRAGSQRDDDIPAFLGVPTGIKDLDLVAGTFTRMGSRAYRCLWSPVDGSVARQVRRAGFVIVGKLATSEFGAMPVTEPDIHPPTRNPWNPRYSAGGSSGGSAAAVAAGMLPIAPGSDGAGSIRIPAAFCHLFGLKPSRAVAGDRYRRVDPIGLSAVGPLAHSVADGAALLDVLNSRATLGAISLPDSFLSRSTHHPRSLRIRFCTRSPLVEVQPFVAAAIEDIAGQLEALGHAVEPAEPLDATVEDFLPLWQRQVATVPVLRESLLQPVTRWLRAEGRHYSAAEIVELAQQLEKRALAWFGDAEAWLTPTVAVPPPRVAAWTELDPGQTFAEASALGVFTAVFNVTGQPAASVPAGVGPDNLPYGVQLAGGPARDADVLALAHQIEEVRPWSDRRPRDAV